MKEGLTCCEFDDDNVLQGKERMNRSLSLILPFGILSLITACASAPAPAVSKPVCPTQTLTIKSEATPSSPAIATVRFEYKLSWNDFGHFTAMVNGPHPYYENTENGDFSNLINCRPTPQEDPDDVPVETCDFQLSLDDLHFVFHIMVRRDRDEDYDDSRIEGIVGAPELIGAVSTEHRVAESGSTNNGPELRFDKGVLVARIRAP